MDIELGDLIRPGRAAEPMLDARDITPGDLAALQVSRASEPPPRKKLRHKHHSLARALAGGMSPGQAAIVAGFAPVTVSILQDDPAFRDLIDFYAADVAKSFDRINEQKVRVASKLLDQVEEDVDKRVLTVNQRRETLFGLLDRTPYGVQRGNGAEVHIHAGLAVSLEQARLRAPPALAAASPLTGSAGASPFNGVNGSVPLTREAGASPLIDATYEVVE